MPQSGVLHRCIALAIAITCVSCGTAGKDKPKVGIAMRSFDNPQAVALRVAIETSALDKAELTLIDGHGQQPAQDLQIDSLFEHKPAALAIEMIDEKSASSLIAKAKERRVPIVFFDWRPSDEAMRSWDKLYFVGFNPSDAATAQGELLSELARLDPGFDSSKDKVIQYAWIGSAVEARAQDELNFSKAMAAAGVKAELLAKGNQADLIMAKFGTKVEALICADEVLTLATIEGLKLAGWAKAKKRIPVIGMGEPIGQVAEALGSGILSGTVFEDESSQGKSIFAVAYALARKLPPAWTGLRVTDAKYVWVPYKKAKASSIVPSTATTPTPKN